MQAKIGSKILGRVGFGAMRLPGVRGTPEDTKLSLQLLRESVSAGVTVIDTADIYGSGLANKLISEALSPYVDELLISTKVGVKLGAKGQVEPAAAPDEIKATVQRDLESLGKSSLDLVFLRLAGGPLKESGVPVQTTLECLAELQADGLIKHIGLSSASKEQIIEAKSIADIEAVQNAHFIGNRESADVVQFCDEESIPFLAYFPLGMGKLIQKKVDLQSLALTHAASESQIALAWLLALSPMIVPIPGTANLEHLRENMAATSFSLSTSEVDYLSAIV